MTTITFKSLKDTDVVGELSRSTAIRERQPDEVVHWRDGDSPWCPTCGRFAAIWLTSDARHRQHPARCTFTCGWPAQAQPLTGVVEMAEAA